MCHPLAVAMQLIRTKAPELVIVKGIGEVLCMPSHLGKDIVMRLFGENDNDLRGKLQNRINNYIN